MRVCLSTFVPKLMFPSCTFAQYFIQVSGNKEMHKTIHTHLICREIEFAASDARRSGRIGRAHTSRSHANRLNVLCQNCIGLQSLPVALSILFAPILTFLYSVCPLLALGNSSLTNTHASRTPRNLLITPLNQFQPESSVRRISLYSIPPPPSRSSPPCSPPYAERNVANSKPIQSISSTSQVFRREATSINRQKHR